MSYSINSEKLGANQRIRNLLSWLLGALTLALLSTSAFAQSNDIIDDPGQARLIEVGSSVTLDGSGSTSPSGFPLTYAWTLVEQPAGSVAVINEASTPRPNLVPDLAGDYLKARTGS